MVEETEEKETETEEVAEVETETVEETQEEEIVVDLDAQQDYETRIEQLEETVEEQREEIDELQDLLLDLSVRVADDRGMGVCPECHGPVVKKKHWFRPTTIECDRCGEQFHEY